jgi:hypothetical protein
MNSKTNRPQELSLPEGPIPSKLSREFVSELTPGFGDRRSLTPNQTIDLECLALSYERQRAEKNSRKEVIQPQVLLQLPCYDFTPITDHTLGGFLPCGLEHRLLVQPTFVM